MSRRLLKFSGGSGETTRDVLHCDDEAELADRVREARRRAGHVSIPLQPTEAFDGFEDARGDPAQHHLPAAPALDVALHVSGAADETLGGVGRGQRALQARRE